MVFLHNLNGIYGARGRGWPVVGPGSCARLFNPFSNSGISVSAPARAPSVPYTPACLPVSLPAWPYERTNAWRRIEAARAPSIPRRRLPERASSKSTTTTVPKNTEEQEEEEAPLPQPRSCGSGRAETITPSDIRAGVLFRAKLSRGRSMFRIVAL